MCWLGRKNKSQTAGITRDSDGLTYVYCISAINDACDTPEEGGRTYPGGSDTDRQE